MSTTKNLGQIVPKYIGEYDASTTYNQLHLVSDGDDTLYISMVNNNTGNPLSDTNYWWPFSSIQGIAAEATRAQTAEATLQDNIDAEATARANADTTLQSNIDAEATARAEADAALQTAIESAGAVDTISINGGTPVEPDENKNVDLTIVQEESDPIFTSSAAYDITTTDITTWNNAAENVAYLTDDGDETTADFDAQADTVWNIEQTLSSTQQAQARTNINAQETLVSGTTIKTVNGSSLLGSGNITISGGEGGSVTVDSTLDSTSENPVQNKVIYEALQAKADSADIPTATSDLTNDSGFITDAGVTSFNGSTGAVTYTAPVTSVNGNTGAVTVSVPSKTSDLINDSGFITDAGVTSVNGSTGAVTVQETLVSGTNIKTVNGSSLLGSGDITISGGEGESISVDSALSSTSENPVQNKAIYSALSGKADSADIPTKVSDLTNDSGFITDAGVTSFNGSTGAVTYSAPVTSVNGSTGAVTISVPDATSDLTNDSGFVTSSSITTIVSISQTDYDALSLKDSSTLYVITS